MHGACCLSQDGTEEAGVAAAQLLPVLHVDDHDFWPGDFVVEKVDMDEGVRACRTPHGCPDTSYE